MRTFAKTGRTKGRQLQHPPFACCFLTLSVRHYRCCRALGQIRLKADSQILPVPIRFPNPVLRWR